MRLPCTWLRTQPAPTPRAGCLLGDEDLVWRTPEPPTQVQVVLGCPACYSSVLSQGQPLSGEDFETCASPWCVPAGPWVG